MNIQDLLSRDLTQVELTPPLLAPGDVLVEITEAKMTKTKNGDPMLEFTLRTVNVEKDTKGGDIAPGGRGSVLIHRIALTAVDKNGHRRDEPGGPIEQDLARFKYGFTGEKSGQFGEPSLFIGRQAVARVDIEETEAYGPQVRIRRFRPVA